jgi:hypothetical protein
MERHSFMVWVTMHFSSIFNLKIDGLLYPTSSSSTRTLRSMMKMSELKLDFSTTVLIIDERAQVRVPQSQKKNI